MKRMWIVPTITAVIMLPAAVGTLCLWCGMDEHTLLWLPGMGLAMLPAAFLRIFYIPYALCLFSAGCTILQATADIAAKRFDWRLPVMLLLTAVSCAGIVSLDVFFPAMMGI